MRLLGIFDPDVIRSLPQPLRLLAVIFKILLLSLFAIVIITVASAIGVYLLLYYLSIDQLEIWKLRWSKHVKRKSYVDNL